MKRILITLAGILLIYTWPKVRYVPVMLAEKLADLAIARKSLALAYLVGAFIVVPLLGIVIL